MTPRKLFLLVFLPVLLLVSASTIHVPTPTASPAADSSTDELSEQLDRWFVKQFPRTGAPGMAVAVVDRDSLVYNRGFGQAQPDSRFYIASLSKSITATAVLLLVQDGLVELDAPVQAYLPLFTTADPSHSAAVTVRHLLNQTSGLSDTGYSASIDLYTSTPQAIATDLAFARPIAAPGETFHYFNPNYDTLGFLVEVVSGQTYEDFVQARIFDPLGLDSAGFSADENTLRGYQQGFGLAFPLFDTVRPPSPSGGVIAAAEDVAGLVQLYLNHGSPLLSPELAGLALTPPGGVEEGYCMGWYTGSTGKIDYLTHGGDIENFHANMALLPEAGYGIVLLYNTNNLIANYSSIPAALNGAVTILSAAGEPPGSVAMWQIGLLILALLAAILFLGIRTISRAQAWAVHASSWQPIRRWLSLTVCLLPALVLVFLPQISLLTSGRTAAHRLLFSYIPDMLIVLGTSAVLGIIHFVVRLRVLNTAHQE